jgi:hypothetical protein
LGARACYGAGQLQYRLPRSEFAESLLCHPHLSGYPYSGHRALLGQGSFDFAPPSASRLGATLRMTNLSSGRPRVYFSFSNLEGSGNAALFEGLSLKCRPRSPLEPFTGMEQQVRVVVSRLRGRAVQTGVPGLARVWGVLFLGLTKYIPPANPFTSPFLLITALVNPTRYDPQVLDTVGTQFSELNTIFFALHRLQE